jgi:hypothetical protein
MNDDELKKLWQQQTINDHNLSAAQLLSAMQNKMSQFRRDVRARDFGELLACAIVVIIFGFYAFYERTPIVRVGWLLVIGGAVFVAGKIIHARRSAPPAAPGATVVESLRAELHSVRTQSRLLGAVLWWYLLPLGVGLLVATWGMPIHLHAKIPATLLYVALFTFIYWLNQAARSKRLLPLEAQLESMLRSADTGEPLNETHLANLRPLVLSMQAADHPKPVEFKVAFWQLAIYGVPGIVGIWFFLTLASTMSDNDWKIKEQPVATALPASYTGETNRYFVVARKVVDLFNAGDYAAVQNLYNPGMTRRFPLKETSEFYRRIAASFGKIESIEGPTGNGYQGWPAFRLHGLRGEMTMSLALDANDQISGIYFKPASLHYPLVPNIKPFLRRFFSWPHLLWGVLSFAGGLLYTWLIQKTVKRAVGISAFGIHLQNGMKLIPWGEIKEVRPFRFLNIRNLWVIQESGEKTRMHWTPLERHSDVKAAVEKFAPANHPIRNYLSLLRRT